MVFLPMNWRTVMYLPSPRAVRLRLNNVAFHVQLRSNAKPCLRVTQKAHGDPTATTMTMTTTMNHPK